MKRIDFIKSYHKDLDGIEFLRSAIYWLDTRNEDENENKNPLQLLSDYVRELEIINP